VKFDETKITPEEAAVLFISVFPLAAVRKTRVEIGESALVMGCGLLGQLTVRQLRAAGAAPIVAADLIPERRADALAGGADFAFDPREADFAAKVKEATFGGAAVCIEVTGRGEGLDTALDCMRRFGRVALLGCTRDKNFTIDYYRKVHFPGITLVGAHTNARPDVESHPGYFTSVDDIRAMMRLIEGGRIELKTLRRETARPEECGNVYERLIRGTDFPAVMQFDWRK
jgi:threonine dehydrogenase-like Zn-dependent dehydrogenase